MTVFTPKQLHLMLSCGAGPELMLVIQGLSQTLPLLGLSSTDVVEFVCQQASALNDNLWYAFRALAGSAIHPLDGYSPVVGPVHRQMTLEEVERVIAFQPEEHVVIFDGREGLQVARFGPSGTRAAGVDPRGRTLLDPLLKLRRGHARGWVLTHNHPTCGTLSDLDLVLAVRLDLAEIRAVCANGALWWCHRPRHGWPTETEMEVLCEEATRLAMPKTENAFREQVSMRRRFGRLDEAWAAFFSAYYTASFNERARAFDDLTIEFQATDDR